LEVVYSPYNTYEYKELLHKQIHFLVSECGYSYQDIKTMGVPYKQYYMDLEIEKIDKMQKKIDESRK
jgi:hypothetical protein